MYVIQLFDEYWLRDANDHIDEVYDLEAATQFKTKKAAKALIASVTLSEYCKIQKYADILPDFLEWKKNGMVRREIPKITEESRKYDGEGLEEVIAFHKYHHTHQQEIRYKDYATWPDVEDFLECFYKTGHYHSMDATETMTTFSVKVNQTAEYEIFKKELELLVPHVTWFDDGYACMSIFDHECSEYESRYFLFNKDEDKHVIRNHRGSELYSGTLEECFYRISGRYYYE
jgi:hypothetical protein